MFDEHTWDMMRVCIDRYTCTLKLLLTRFGLNGVKKYERLSNTSQHSLVYPIAHNWARPRGYKSFSMLNSAEHGINLAHKY